MVTYREGIAIGQVVFYIPALTGGIFLALRHGFAKSSGWILLITFSLLRLTGAIFELIAVNHPSRQVITGAIVCISIGLSPLTLMCLGFMQRINQEVGQPIPSIIYRVINLGGLIALCLGIYGGVKQADSNSTNPADYTNVNHFSKIAVILFTIIFIVVVLIYLVLAAHFPHIPHGEKRLLLAVGLSFPFLVVRYIYALVADFAHNKNFNSFFGNATIYLLMAVATECIVIVISEIMGFTLQVVSKGTTSSTSDPDMLNGYAPVKPLEEHAYSENIPLNSQLGRSTSLPKAKARGPVSWLYLQAKDNFKSHN